MTAPADVIDLAQRLIRCPSRAGIDGYGPVLGVLEDWLAGRGLPYRRLHGDSGDTVGLLVEVAGGRPGPWWALDACVDTAPYGDEAAWSFAPDSGEVVDGWLRGRGAADSKLAAAMFCGIAAELHGRAGACTAGSRYSSTSTSTRAASGAPAPTSPTGGRPARPG
ncbi:hypothetical protein WKI71_03380 [Streptomyces sp. MS1.AVA.1]|uniref:Uncharacterized protein n=1 Tax=Streptomyces machairae TaxID=3134109 RepID=A0ABU8UHY6_9ACTN